jgi:hypothetical protein
MGLEIDLSAFIGVYRRPNELDLEYWNPRSSAFIGGHVLNEPREQT